ncbi:MAG TPA: CRTAC1 family protein, partial [Vicinamibacteria bacterium]
MAFAAALAAGSTLHPLGAQAQPPSRVQFTDVTAAARVTFKHTSGAAGKKRLPETMGSGVVVLDFDGDGWQDLFFVNSKK